MTLRQQILQIVKEAFAKGERRESASSTPLNPASPDIHAHYKSLHDISETIVGDVLQDLSNPSLLGYIIYDEKNYKTILWNTGKLIAYRKADTPDFCVRQIRNVSIDHLFRYLTK